MGVVRVRVPRRALGLSSSLFGKWRCNQHTQRVPMSRSWLWPCRGHLMRLTLIPQLSLGKCETRDLLWFLINTDVLPARPKISKGESAFARFWSVNPLIPIAGTIHQRFNGKGYFFSWNDPRTAGQEVDWLTSRNFCRQRCMDLVSLETSAENEFIKSRIVQSIFLLSLLLIFARATRTQKVLTNNVSFLIDKIKYIWTSGRLCDFKGCDRPDLQPLNINGWFWTAELQKLAPTNDRSQNDWSESGGWESFIIVES